MGVHPCCGGSLQTGTKIVAMIQIIFSTILVILSIFFIVGSVILVSVVSSISKANGTDIFHLNGTESHFDVHGLSNDGGNGTHPNIPAGAVTAFSVFLGILVFLTLVTSVCSLIMGIVLWQGAKQRSMSKCRCWLIIRSILMVITFISFLGDFFHPQGTGSGSLTSTAIGLVLDFYSMWVVYAFINELREEDASMKRSMYTIKP